MVIVMSHFHEVIEGAWRDAAATADVNLDSVAVAVTAVVILVVVVIVLVDGTFQLKSSFAYFTFLSVFESFLLLRGDDHRFVHSYLMIQIGAVSFDAFQQR